MASEQSPDESSREIDLETYISLIKPSLDRSKSWVLFKNGTIVVLATPSAGDDLGQVARDLLAEWGPVAAGCSFGDFGTINLKDDQGYAVTCHHNDILTFVHPSELPSDRRNDVSVGFYGRAKRGADARGLEVVHVEDARNVDS